MLAGLVHWLCNSCHLHWQVAGSIEPYLMCFSDQVFDSSACLQPSVVWKAVIQPASLTPWAHGSFKQNRKCALCWKCSKKDRDAGKRALITTLRMVFHNHYLSLCLEVRGGKRNLWHSTHQIVSPSTHPTSWKDKKEAAAVGLAHFL